MIKTYTKGFFRTFLLIFYLLSLMLLSANKCLVLAQAPTTPKIALAATPKRQLGCFVDESRWNRTGEPYESSRSGSFACLVSDGGTYPLLLKPRPVSGNRRPLFDEPRRFQYPSSIRQVKG